MPLVGKAKSNRCPGASVPEFHPLASDVDVWATESVFVHDTVVPAATVSELGLNPFGPSASAPLGIEMVVDDPFPLGVAVGVGVGATVGE